MKPALVVSGNHAGMAIVHGLGIQGVPVVALTHGQDILGASKYVVASMPIPDPQTHEADFVARLVSLSKAFEGCPVVPANDEALVALARNKPILSEHLVVACPEWEVVRQYIDKAHTYELANEVGVRAPETFCPTGPEDIDAVESKIQFPCLVKPREGHLFHRVFGKKMFPVHNMDELRAGFRRAHEAGLGVMIQDFIPGDDACGVNYNSYSQPGRARVEFTARKVRNSPPQYGSPRVVVSERIPEIIESGRRLLDHMGYFGFSCMEFKLDERDGEYKLMEINGRHNRSAMLAVRCGINFPWIEYAHLILGQATEPGGFDEGIYWIDLLSDLKHSVKHRRFERYTMTDYARPYREPHVFGVLDSHDMKPFLRRASAALMNTFRR